MRVKTSKIRNLYVLIVHEPRSTNRIASRRVSREPFAPVGVGDVVRARGERLRVTAVTTCVEQRGETTEHITRLFTVKTLVHLPSNVVRMPTADHDHPVAQFLRYHVLIRVYHGDPEAWLAQLQRHGDEADGGDLRFVRCIRWRLRQDPKLLVSIRRLVDATPFWRVAEA